MTADTTDNETKMAVFHLSIYFVASDHKGSIGLYKHTW